ncbi:MAG: hypothetical protein ACK55X_01080 [Synechococcaceae cyanobacterium]
MAVAPGAAQALLAADLTQRARARRSSFGTTSRVFAVILPPLSMDVGLLLIAIGVVNLWRARQPD